MLIIERTARISFRLYFRMHWLDCRIVRKQLDIITTYHYVQNQGKLIMHSRENGKSSTWAIF